jgi:uncharacterized protein YecT (DUF1311 family)
MGHAKHLLILGLLFGGAVTSPAAQAGASGCSEIPGSEAKANCLVKQLRDSDESLNTAYQNRLGQLSELGKNELRQQQRGWLRERDRDCKLQGVPSERELWLEWLERHPDQMICATRHAQERAVQLQPSVQGASESSAHATDDPSGALAFKIDSAIYASPHGQSFDVTAQLRSACASATSSCLISCGNQLAGDPDFGTPKSCRIVYVCGDRHAQEVQLREGERSMLGCSPGAAGQAGRSAAATDGASSTSPPSAGPGRDASVGPNPITARPPPQESARLQAAATVAQRWANAGNFNRAVALLESFASAPDTSPSDRFLADANLLHYYTQLDDHVGLLRIEQARLASDYFGADARTAEIALIQRAGLMLQIARDELAQQRFGEAGQSAAAILQLLGDTGEIGELAQEHTDATQIARLAQSHQSAVPTPKAFVDREAAAVDAAMPSFSATDAATACASVLQHANSDMLKSISVPWSALPETSSGTARSRLEQQGAIDFFGDGTLVLVGSDNGELTVRRSDGPRAELVQTPDQNWDEGDGSDPMLLRVGVHYYVLAADGMQLLHLSEFSRNHVERKACEFVPLPPPPSDAQASVGRPHYELRTPLEQLIADANSLQVYTLTRYVMVEPGIDAVRAVLDASRRKDNPIALVPEPSYRDPAGESIVVSAVKARRYDVLQFLLDHGVDPNLADHGLRFNPNVLPDSPLAVAVKNDDLTAARILLTHGAHPNAGGQLARSNLLTETYASGSVAMFGLLLDEGADPDSVSPPGAAQDALQPSPKAPDTPARIDLLLSHGADPDWWVSALFNAVAIRSGLASATQRLEREGGTLPESALYTPVKADWITELLASPVRAPDNGLEPLLREATAIRAASPCPGGTKVIRSARICRLPRAAQTSARSEGSGGAELPPVAAGASPIPLSNRAAFVTYAAAQLQQRLTGFTVSMDQGTPSMLIIDPRGAKVGHLNIRQTYEWCRGQAAPCSDLLSRWLQAAQSAVQSQQRTPDPKDLILLLGPREMFEKLAAPRASTAPPIAMRPCVADLVCVLGVKNFGSARLIDEDDLLHMRLTIDQGLQIAQEQTQAQLGAISALKPLSISDSLAFNDDTDLEGSRLALLPEWQDLVARGGDDLIAAVPAANIVVYARADRPQAIEGLRKFAQEVYPTAVQPVSTEVFRWGAAGWRVIP